MLGRRRKSEGRDRDLLSRIKRPFPQAATPSRPHSQHPWRFRKYDAIPSMCLSPYRWQQLEDPFAESPCSMTDGLVVREVRDPSTLGLMSVYKTRHIRTLCSTMGFPRARALSATLRSWMMDTPLTEAQEHRYCRSPMLSTVLGLSAAHAPPGTHWSGRSPSARRIPAVVDSHKPSKSRHSGRAPCLSMAFYSDSVA